MTIGKGIFIFFLFGLFAVSSAIGADELQITSFSTVLTESAQQVSTLFPI